MYGTIYLDDDIVYDGSLGEIIDYDIKYIEGERIENQYLPDGSIEYGEVPHITFKNILVLKYMDEDEFDNYKLKNAKLIDFHQDYSTNIYFKFISKLYVEKSGYALITLEEED